MENTHLRSPKVWIQFLDRSRTLQQNEGTIGPSVETTERGGNGKARKGKSRPEQGKWTVVRNDVPGMAGNLSKKKKNSGRIRNGWRSRV